MIDTAQKRQAALSTSVRGILPLPDGSTDVIDRGLMVGVYWIANTSGGAGFVMIQNPYQSEGKISYRPNGKCIYQPVGKVP